MNRNEAALGNSVVLLLSHIVNATDRQLFAVLAPDVRKALGVTLAQVGLAATASMLGMAADGQRRVAYA